MPIKSGLKQCLICKIFFLFIYCFYFQIINNRIIWYFNTPHNHYINQTHTKKSKLE